MTKVAREIVVTNKQGLHARPAMQLVDLANRFESDITFERPGAPGEAPETVADAKSVMAVITLAATQGTRLLLKTEGPDAEEAAEAMQRLFAERFGEE